MKFVKTAHKTTTRIAISVLLLIVVVFVVSSPLAKYFVQKYDVSYLGREVTVDWVYVNPFTGFIYLSDPKVKELRNDTTFFSAQSISANIEVYKLFFSNYSITELEINKPIGFVIQKNKDLNFNDIIKKFTPSQLSSGTSTRFSIQNISIIDGEFHYREKIIPIDYFIKNVNLESSGIFSTADTIASTFSFRAGKGTGFVNGNFTINTRTQDYRLATVIDDLDLELIRQYLWELINYGMFRARLNANLTASGNFKNVRFVSVKGKLSVNDFHLGKTTTEDYIACSRLSLVVDELSPNNSKYTFDSLTMDDPFISFERFDSLDNFQALFGKGGSNISDVTSQHGRFNLLITIGRYLTTLGQNFFRSKYHINSLAINNGRIKFTDFSLSEKFMVQANSIYFRGDSIRKSNKRVKFYLKSTLHPFGSLSAQLSINPLDSGDLDFNYQIDNFPATAFNPYFLTYTSFPLDQGQLNLNGKWKVREGIIESENNILLIDPRVGARSKGDETKWIPLPLIMSLVRERGSVINYQVPITGNLNNPRFHLRDVVTDLFVNAFIKPPTVAYGLEVKRVEKNIDDLLNVTWKVHQFELEPDQQKFLGRLTRFLKRNPKTSIEVRALDYEAKEKEHILFFESRKKYYLLINQKTESEFTEKDSLVVERIPVKELGHYFTKDLTKITHDTTMFTIVDKCNHFLASDIVERKYKALLRFRQNQIKSAFVEIISSDQVKFQSSNSTIPYDGFSTHQIKYDGQVPPSLRSSYEKMRTLNHRSFRRKYFTPYVK